MKKFLINFLLASFVLVTTLACAASGEKETTVAADITQKDRIMGAIMGVFVGDALGVGTHWYYDLDGLKHDFGPWISEYQDPKLNSVGENADVHKYRYEQGVRAGDLSQTGQLYTLLLESIVAQGGYDRNDFAARVDGLFETLNGRNFSGLYTDSAIRATWKHRNAGVSWDDPKVGSNQITSDAAQMNVALAALFFADPELLAKSANKNTKLFYYNEFPIAHSVAYSLVVGGLINGVPLADMKEHILSINGRVLSQNAFYYDTRIQVETGQTAWNPDLQMAAPHLMAKVYGQHCEIQQLLPAAYYFVHLYQDDFESAVLAAINGGGNNMARASLTGGMSGAMVGLSGIPERLIEGLTDHEELLALAEKVADLTQN
jgi:ADP-ribosyl-[dinitrogen reductase] hydrolase